jgi:hypothetical protein
MARRAPERMKEHTAVCDWMSDKRNAASSKKDQLKGAIAQLGERLPCTQEVSGSIPLGSTSFRFATEFIHESFDWMPDVWSLISSLFKNVEKW